MQCIGCGRVVHKHCSCDKCPLSTIGDAFASKVCEKPSDGENINIQESMDLGNGVFVDSWKVLLSGGHACGSANSASVVRVCYASG